MGTSSAGRFVALAFVLGLACNVGPQPQADAGPDARLSTRGASAVFVPPAVGDVDWGTVPFPGDLFVGDDGHVAIGEMPEASPVTAPAWDAVREVLETRDGFCMTCGVHFPVAGYVDAASLPVLPAPGAAASPSDSILFVDVDAGALIPVRAEWNVLDQEISVRPVRGVTLEPGGRYVAALTDGVLGLDGTPLEVSEVFRALRDGGAATPAGDRARAMVEEAFEALGALGIERGRVVSTTAYGVWDPRTQVAALRDIVHGAAVPTAIFDEAHDRVWVGADLDSLFGQPSEDRPGLDVAPMNGTGGSRAIAHSHIAAVTTGSFEAPRVVAGDGGSGDVGVLRRGADGGPRGGPAQSIPFTLAVPAGAELSRLPVMVYQTGLGDDRQLALALADTVCAAGVALLAIEPFQQGERLSSAIDDRHWLRDPSGETGLGPDGLFEADSAEASRRLLAVHSDASPLGFPGYLVGTVAQQITDLFAAFRFVREGDLTALVAASPSLAGLAFDPGAVYFGGDSQGASVGAVALAFEADVRGAVLHTPWASYIELLAESPHYRSRGNVLFLVLGVRAIEDVLRSMVMHPLVDLYRFVIEPIEPLVFARHLYREPLTMPRPDLLVQLFRHDEVVPSPTTEAWLSAAAIPGFGAFTFAPVALVAAPVRSNLPLGDEFYTVAAAQTDADHFARVLRADTRRYEEPIEPPFRRRPQPLAVDQPISELHRQLTHFLVTSRDGAAEVCAVGACR